MHERNVDCGHSSLNPSCSRRHCSRVRFLSVSDGFVDFAMFLRPCGALVCFCSILIVFLVILSFLCDCVGFLVLHDGRKKRWKPSKLRPNQCRDTQTCQTTLKIRELVAKLTCRMRWRQKLPDWLMPRLNQQGLSLRRTAWEVDSSEVAGHCAKRLAGRSPDQDR